MAEKRTIDLLDLYLSSFLSLNGISPKLEVKSGKVHFVFDADDRIYHLMNLFNWNVEVPIVDFVTTVKTLRGKMLTLKESNGNGKGARYGKTIQ
jgi:hypothetical protein